jgi:Fe2+ or Zn2+ uptake regulation protein
MFDILREAGAKGLTAQDVHKEIEKKLRRQISSSKVYGLLRRFYQEKSTHRYFDNAVESQRNVITLEWGMVEFDGD